MPKRKPNDPDRSADMPHNWVERHIERAEELVYFNSSSIDQWKYRRSRLVREGEYEQLDPDWQFLQLGDQWGGEDVTAFFEKELIIPGALNPGEGEELVLDIDLDGGECQLKLNGRAWQGLDRYRRIVPLKNEFKAGDKLLLEMEAFVINYPYDARSKDERVLHTFRQARFMLMDQILSDFVQDARFILNAYMAYWKDDSNLEVEAFLLHHLEEACRILGPGFSGRNEARTLCRKASDYLKKNVYETEFYRSSGIVNICGHSHLDVVYLWPVKETFRKNCRTASNMLSLMREYPDFKFSSSQPYLFEKLKEMYPAVFEEVRQRIKEKRWEVTGGMYIEPDGNLLGAESLVRQILFGKKFYQEEFGINTEVCWLPDVFGVMYTLPQILKKSGIHYFSSIKLNIWNDTNDFPYNTFKWRGPDGSEILTHFPPTHFAGDCRPEIIRKNWEGFKEKNTFGESLFLYGWADGGGGPTREMAEAAKRSENFPGLPQCKTLFVEDYLKTLD
ncbi:MAG: hypothetical protein PQJ58_12985, partial [Spirochaetales bacterium]|nr:hypothetical protein [Spirochaetales bacterium]